MEWVDSYLIGDSLGGSQFLQFQWRGSTGEHIPMEGFPYWVTKELENFTSVQRATKGEGAPEFGHISFWILWKRF